MSNAECPEQLYPEENVESFIPSGHVERPYCKIHGYCEYLTIRSNLNKDYNGSYCLFCIIEKLGLKKLKEV